MKKSTDEHKEKYKHYLYTYSIKIKQNQTCMYIMTCPDKRNIENEKNENHSLTIIMT